MNKRCMILGYSTNICRELHDELTERGNDCRVVCMREQGMYVPIKSRDLVGLDALTAFSKITSEIGPVDSVVFDIVNNNEIVCDINNYGPFVDSVEGIITLFFETLQSITQHLITRSGSQIWVLTREDSLSYHVPVDINPIIAHAQHAVVRSVAKEISHFGIFINAAMLQFSAQELSPEAWKTGRGLKAYSSRFKPFSSRSMARFLSQLISLPELPINGVVMNIGLGTCEYNI